MLQTRTRTFKWSFPTVRGSEIGWLPVEAGDGWYPGGGFVTAHDVVEHLSDKSDWAHELRAAGVALFSVRYVPGRSIQSISDDILGFASREHAFRVPQAPARWSKPLHAFHENRLQAFAQQLRDQLARGIERAKAAGVVIPREAIDNAPTFVERALPWFRLGYRTAQRVYRRGDDTGRLLDKVRDAVNDDHDRTPPVLGDTLTVSINTREHTFTIERKGNERMTRADRQRRAMGEGLSAHLQSILA